MLISDVVELMVISPFVLFNVMPGEEERNEPDEYPGRNEMLLPGSC